MSNDQLPNEFQLLAADSPVDEDAAPDPNSEDILFVGT
jgi:hypothetical protein